jgi:hypothetical protein
MSREPPQRASEQGNDQDEHGDRPKDNPTKVKLPPSQLSIGAGCIDKLGEWSCSPGDFIPIDLDGSDRRRTIASDAEVKVPTEESVEIPRRPEAIWQRIDDFGRQETRHVSLSVSVCECHVVG